MTAIAADLLACPEYLALAAAVQAAPADALARNVLADWLEEHGAGDAAAAERREGAARLLAARLVAAKVWLSSADVFTPETARAAKGYMARSAESYLAANPGVLVYVVTDHALTRTGLRRDATGVVLYHRRSTGGRYSRSKQILRVSP